MNTKQPKSSALIEVLLDSEKAKLKHIGDCIEINYELGVSRATIGNQYTIDQLGRNFAEGDMIVLSETFNPTENPDGVRNPAVIIPIVIGVISVILALISTTVAVLGYVNGGKCKKVKTVHSYKETTKYSNGTTEVRSYSDMEITIEC